MCHQGITRPSLQALRNVSILAVLGGCSAMLPQRYQLTAPPLAALYASSQSTDVVPALLVTDQQKIGYLISDSMTKCSGFVNSMFAEHAATGLTLDIASTITSALASVFTPISVTHSLSAASTIFSGAKTSLDAEYLNSLTISHIVQAIQSTYSTQMQYEINKISTANPVPSADLERLVIQSIHNSCSLANAEGTISATLQSPTTPSSSANVTYPVTAADTSTAHVASGIAALISNSADFKNAGITASSNGNVVTLKPAASGSISVVPSSDSSDVAFKSGTPATITVQILPAPGDKITVSVAGSSSSTGGGTSPAKGQAPSGAAAQGGPSK